MGKSIEIRQRDCKCDFMFARSQYYTPRSCKFKLIIYFLFDFTSGCNLINHFIIQHPKNVLIHKNSIKLVDFGCSYLQGSNYHTKVHGVIPYMDPNFFNIQESDRIILTGKSDIYSLGVLLWELTSRSSPFDFKNLDDFMHFK